MSASGPLRLFFALWPDASALVALRRVADVVASQRGGRAPREGNLHVTVAFLGSVASERLPELATIGESCACDSTPFVLTLDKVGGTAKGIAWLAPSNVPQALVALHQTLAAKLNHADFATERRRFRPHVTLARHCSLPARRQEVVPIAWRVDRLALIASTPAPGGSRYAETAAWPLGGSMPY